MMNSANESARQKRATHRSAAGAKTMLLCTTGQWMAMVFSGLLVAGLAWPRYGQVSIWIGVVLFLMTVTVAHLVFTSDVMVPFPHIAILITGLQYVLAAWLSYYYPSETPIYNIGERLPEYLNYAGWVTTAICMGWAMSLWGLPRRTFPSVPAPAALLAELDILFWFGIVCTLLSHFVHLGGLGFVLILCANLRYLGALGRMLVRGPGWQWRVVLTLLLEILLAVHGGMFHGLLLWSASVFALYIYQRHPGRGFVLGCIAVGILLLPPLEEAKFYIRGKEWTGDEPQSSLFSLATIENAGGWMQQLGSGLIKSAEGDWDPDFLSYIMVRYNQGWIINRVMETVPSSEPYAKGATLIADVKAALLPRILFPDKLQAGGQGLMDRYAGYSMTGNTSMNLGYAGEMFANFGFWGGVAGCFGYALLLGLAFRWICRRAALNPLWWAFVPYVGLVGLKAEEGIGDVWNWLVKAAVVSAVVYFNFPAIRAALSRTQLAGQPQLSPKAEAKLRLADAKAASHGYKIKNAV